MRSDDKQIHWFASRAGNCQTLSAKRKLEKWNIEHFVPTMKTMAVRSGRKRMVEKPLAGNLVFIRGIKNNICDLINYGGLPVHMIPDRCGKDSALIVPDKQMEDFRRVYEFSLVENQNPDIILETGDHVRVIAGDLAGVEGDVIEADGLTYVSVSLYGMLQARAKMPAAFLEKI